MHSLTPLFLSQGLASLSFFLFTVPSLGVILTKPSQLNTTTFDYVIVGAGTAGLVIANRLTENSSISVLVIEAGLSDAGIVSIQVPWLAPTLSPGTSLDWNTSTVAQAGLVQRVLPYNRGRILGGSSSTNFLFHQYCSSEDWDRLGSISGDVGWNWANMRQYVQKHEALVPPTDKHGTSAQVLAATHGTTGEVSISLPGFNETIDSKIYNTTQQLAEFPYLPDTSGGDTLFLGIGFIQSSAGGGIRSSSSTSYLSNANGRPNLTVLTNATAIKLVQSGKSAAGLPSFRIVQLISSPPPGSLTVGTPFNVTARNDAILSAGAVGTTQLLQLSGIGNSTDLTKLKINTIVSNPSVGANLTDHLLIPNIFSVNGMTLDGLLKNETQQAEAMNQWTSSKTGPYANSVANMYGFLRLPSNSTIFATTPDPAAGPNSPHYEMIFTYAWFNPGTPFPSNGKVFLTIVTVVVSPTSRGTIKLSSSNPLQMPLVDPQFMTTEFDIFTARESVNAAQQFIAAPPWGTYVVGPFGSAFSMAVGNDTAIETYIRSIGVSAFHPVGTAAMSASTAKTGVVNPNMTVKGADGLRVVDASVFPFIPSCHTQGSVYLLAERASDIIKAANNGTVIDTHNSILGGALWKKE